MDLARILARVISGIASVVDASNLRNRIHLIQNEHEIMWTALDDIARMNKDHSSGILARKTLEQIKITYGR